MAPLRGEKQHLQLLTLLLGTPSTSPLADRPVEPQHHVFVRHGENITNSRTSEVRVSNLQLELRKLPVCVRRTLVKLLVFT